MAPLPSLTRGRENCCSSKLDEWSAKEAVVDKTEALNQRNIFYSTNKKLRAPHSSVVRCRTSSLCIRIVLLIPFTLSVWLFYSVCCSPLLLSSLSLSGFLFFKFTSLLSTFSFCEFSLKVFCVSHLPLMSCIWVWYHQILITVWMSAVPSLLIQVWVCVSSAPPSQINTLTCSEETNTIT